jgi:CRP/FNR family cyclic AMP-dependent transcriptional regulator
MLEEGSACRLGAFNSEQTYPRGYSPDMGRAPSAETAEGAKVEQADEILVELAKLGETRTWEPGTAVVTEGDMADCMYIVHAGELRAVVAGEGGRNVELNTLGAGDFFGELMLSGERRAATVEVIVRARLTRVTRAEVERVLASRPDLAFHLIQRMVQRVRTLTHTVSRLASVDVYGRLIGLFDALAVDDGGRRVVLGPLSQTRIAERLGASRAMVNRLLQDLTQGGYIEVSRERIVLLGELPRRW